jgi:hypothetical protein
MKNEIKCPKCNQVTNQMIDHLPLEFKTMQFDDELYATFQCLQIGCHEVFKKVLKVSVPEQKQTEDKGLMIVVEREVPRQVIEDVFVTALEGGSNYWYFLPDEAIDLIRKAVPKSVDPYQSTAISKAIEPLQTATPCLRPATLAIPSSSLLTKGPSEEIHPVSIHSMRYCFSLPSNTGSLTGIIF